MDILLILFYGIPASIFYLLIISYIWDNMNISTKIRKINNQRYHLRQFKKRLNEILKDDDHYCIKEKILLAIKDYHNYIQGYGRKYYERAEDELWIFLMEYLDKDKLFLEEL